MARNQDINRSRCVVLCCVVLCGVVLFRVCVYVCVCIDTVGTCNLGSMILVHSCPTLVKKSFPM